MREVRERRTERKSSDIHALAHCTRIPHGAANRNFELNEGICGRAGNNLQAEDKYADGAMQEVIWLCVF